MIGVTDIRLGTQPQDLTRFVIEFTSTVDYHLFLLNNPPRAVLDLPLLRWQGVKPQSPAGLVTRWRSGQFGQGTRIVLDLTTPAQIYRAEAIARANKQQGMRLVIDLKAAITPAAQAPKPALSIETLIAPHMENSTIVPQPPQQPEGTNFADIVNKAAQMAAIAGNSWGTRPLPTEAEIKPNALLQPPALPVWRRSGGVRPLIIIDAGPGGVDPGAIAATGQQEKDLTLAMAKALGARLADSGAYRVGFTRTKDVFIPLKERVMIARRKGADLFISLHADSTSDGEAEGATLYTLSEQASDAEAAALADSENRADLMAGLEQAKNDDNLANILINMNHTATHNLSHAFSAILAQNLKRNFIKTTRIPERSAGFAVLKAPDIPSLLFEMGYISNEAEVRRLFTPRYQEQLVQSLATAIDQFFKSHPPQRETATLLPVGLSPKR